MSPFVRTLDIVGSMNIRTKMTICSCFAIILIPLAILVGNETLPPGHLENYLAVWIAGGLIVLFPLSSGLLHLLVLRKVGFLNRLCLRIKEGDYALFDNLPSSPIEGDEIQNLEYNMYWMGHVIGSRQRNLVEAMDKLEQARKQVHESLDYASLIQTAFLPPADRFHDIFTDHFLIWEQRDEVGGDSYWLKETPHGHFFAIVDCTGHGVPGAFMTLIVQSLFEHQEVAALEGDPAALLGAMNQSIKKALAQHSSSAGSDDGMDCVIFWLSQDRSRLVFAGARNGLMTIGRDGTVAEYKGDRCGAGYVRSPDHFSFTNNDIDIEPGMRFYTMTDGLVDQVGGHKSFPFGKRRLRRFIIEQLGNSFAQQRRDLMRELGRYMGAQSRRDDITVLGFEL